MTYLNYSQFLLKDFQKNNHKMILCYSNTDWIDKIKGDQIWIANLALVLCTPISGCDLRLETPGLCESTYRSFWNRLESEKNQMFLEH